MYTIIFISCKANIKHPSFRVMQEHFWDFHALLIFALSFPFEVGAHDEAFKIATEGYLGENYVVIVI